MAKHILRFGTNSDKSYISKLDMAFYTLRGEHHNGTRHQCGQLNVNLSLAKKNKKDDYERIYEMIAINIDD